MALRWLFQITKDEQTCVEFLRERHILRTQPPSCTLCARQLTEVKTGRGESKQWRCPTHKGIKVAFRQGSFWERSWLSYENIIQLVFLWAHRESIKNTAEYTGIRKTTCIHWFSNFRSICSHHLLVNPHQIGGPGKIVEMSEIAITKRNHDSHPVEPRWVFGGKCLETNEGFLLYVNNRSAATLTPLIVEHIAPGSIIHSKDWAANEIENLPVTPPYQHSVICNRSHVDPLAGTSSKHVECMWKAYKKKIKFMSGVHDSTLPSHLDEFMWRQQYGKTNTEAFDNILLHLSQWYPLP